MTESHKSYGYVAWATWAEPGLLGEVGYSEPNTAQATVMKYTKAQLLAKLKANPNLVVNTMRLGPNQVPEMDTRRIHVVRDQWLQLIPNDLDEDDLGEVDSPHTIQGA